MLPTAVRAGAGAVAKVAPRAIGATVAAQGTMVRWQSTNPQAPIERKVVGTGKRIAKSMWGRATCLASDFCLFG